MCTFLLLRLLKYPENTFYSLVNTQRHFFIHCLKVQLAFFKRKVFLSMGKEIRLAIGPQEANVSMEIQLTV